MKPAAKRQPIGATVLAAVAVVLVSPAAPPFARAPVRQISDEAVLRAATVYVDAYRKAVAFLLADESYTQSRREASGRELERRNMIGELFLSYLEGDDAWIAVHDVLAIDGVPVPGRESLQDLLRKGGTLSGIAGRVVERNAQFNIGTVWRNFNEPTLALRLLEPDRVSGVKFTRKSVTTGGDATLVTLGYEERDRATLVRGPRGPIRARGEMTIEADTGRVRRTTFAIEQSPLSAELVTVYTHHEGLDLWLPSTFTERYEGDTPAGAREVIATEARYTNYRKFTATGRIKR